MTLAYILVFVIIAAVLGVATRTRGHLPLLLAVSALAVYALQPALPVRGLDFWLPTLTLGLAVLAWVLTTPRQKRLWRDNWPGIAILGGIVIVLGLTRYLGISLPLTASNPPQIQEILVLLAILGVAGLLLWRFSEPGKLLLSAAFLIVIIIFLILKGPGVFGVGQPGSKGFERTINCTGFSAGFKLAGVFVYSFPPSAYTAGSAERTPTGCESVRICGLRNLLPGVKRWSDRPHRTFCGRFAPSPGSKQ